MKRLTKQKTKKIYSKVFITSTLSKSFMLGKNKAKIRKIYKEINFNMKMNRLSRVNKLLLPYIRHLNRFSCLKETA